MIISNEEPRSYISFIKYVYITFYCGILGTKYSVLCTEYVIHLISTQLVGNTLDVDMWVGDVDLLALQLLQSGVIRVLPFLPSLHLISILHEKVICTSSILTWGVVTLYHSQLMFPLSGQLGWLNTPLRGVVVSFWETCHMRPSGWCENSIRFFSRSM